MKTWKRNALIAYLACSLAVVVMFLVFGMGSSVPGILKFLFVLLAMVALAGIAAGTSAVAYALLHERATLHAGPEGVINIERSALESTARRALGSVEGITLQKVVARVIERKGEPVIDLTVTAVPYGSASLMVTAGRIQTAAKRAVESFTDHEVRYVAVNFVEPKKRQEVKAASEAEEARAAAGYAPPRYPGFKGSEEEVDSEKSSAREGRTSIWERVKGRVSEVRSKAQEPDEDVVETDAVVESVEFTGPHGDPAAVFEADVPAGAERVDAPGATCGEEQRESPDPSKDPAVEPLAKDRGKTCETRRVDPGAPAGETDKG